jgi:hypothetical protein
MGSCTGKEWTKRHFLKDFTSIRGKEKVGEVNYIRAGRTNSDVNFGAKRVPRD